MTGSFLWPVSILGFYFHLISAPDTFPQFPHYKEIFLNEHNEYRKRHHAPPLEWKNKYETYYLGPPGMNYWVPDKNTSLKDLFTTDDTNPVKAWYSGIKYYPRGSYEQWRSFTMLIWKSTRYLWCEVMAESVVHPGRLVTDEEPPPTRDSKLINAACGYQPRGNTEYTFHENIFKVDGTSWGNNNKSLQEARRAVSITEDNIGSSADGSSKTPIGSKDHEKLSTPGDSKTPISSQDYKELSTPSSSKTPIGNKDHEESSTPGSSKTPNGSKDHEESSTPGSSKTPNGSKDREESSIPGDSKTSNGSKDREKSSMSHRIYGLDFLITTLLGVFLAVFI